MYLARICKTAVVNSAHSTTVLTVDLHTVQFCPCVQWTRVPTIAFTTVCHMLMQVCVCKISCYISKYCVTIGSLNGIPIYIIIRHTHFFTFILKKMHFGSSLFVYILFIMLWNGVKRKDTDLTEFHASPSSLEYRCSKWLRTTWHIRFWSFVSDFVSNLNKKAGIHKHHLDCTLHKLCN